MLFKIIIIAVIFCSGPVIIFFLARKFFGMTKEQEQECINRSVPRMLLILEIIIIVPCLLYLISIFFNNGHSKHIGDFSIQSSYNFYTNLFSRLTKF